MFRLTFKQDFVRHRMIRNDKIREMFVPYIQIYTNENDGSVINPHHQKRHLFFDIYIMN